MKMGQCIKKIKNKKKVKPHLNILHIHFSSRKERRERDSAMPSAGTYNPEGGL